MILSFLTLIITRLTFSILISFNPLTLGITILFISLILSISFASAISSWVSFLIFLIYIGGILVIFSYFVALIPNQNISILFYLSILTFTFIIILSISIILYLSPPIISQLTNQLNIIYSILNTPTLIFLAWLLLFTIIVVVKIVTHTKGPLRPFNYV